MELSLFRYSPSLFVRVVYATRKEKKMRAGERLELFSTLRLCIFLFGFLCEAIENEIAWNGVYFDLQLFPFYQHHIHGVFSLRVF